MKYVKFGDTGLEVSRLGFGCAPMGSRFSRRESLRALDAAFDCGVTLFDTARSYGYGDAEGILGRFLRGRRHRVVVSTKFGMSAGKSSPVKRALKAVARQVFRFAPQVKAIATPKLGAQFTRGGFSLAEMKTSVELSLSELGTDYIDVLFLHGCPAEVLNDDALFDALDALVRQGKVRFYGLASSAAVICEGVRRRPAQVRVVQFHQNLLSQEDAEIVAAEPAAAGAGKMAHQPFSGPEGVAQMRRAIEQMGRDEGVARALRDKLLRGDEGLFADVALNGVLRNTGVDVTVSSMFSVPHIRTNAQVVGASRFSDEEIAEVQRFFRARPPA